MTYILIYIYLSVCSIITLYTKKMQRQWIMYSSVIVIILFQSLRWRTGTDWLPYYDVFTHAVQSNEKGMEIAYYYLNYLIRLITDNYTIFLFIESSLLWFFNLKFIKYFKTPNPSLVILYLFTLAIFPIRFSIAMSIIWSSYQFMIERKFLPFLLTIVIAFLIHKSVIIFLPVYFIATKDISNKMLLFIYGTCIVVGLATDFLFGSVLRFASAIYSEMDGTTQSKMNAYISQDIPEYGKMSTLRYVGSIINSSFFILLYMYLKKKYCSKNKIYSILLNLYVFGISINRLFILTIPDLTRLTSLFAVGQVIMLTMVISKLKRNNQLIWTTILCLYYYISYNGSIHGIYEDLFIPYMSVLENAERLNVY